MAGMSEPTGGHMPFQYDVFVSYAHVDDIPEPGLEQGWVTTLIGSLKRRLAQRLGRQQSFSLWKDEQLRGHVQVTPEILDAVRRSATLLVILSKGYLESPWCKLERQTFLDAVRSEADAGTRIFVIERDRAARTDRPLAFAGVRGYCFWVERDGVPLTLGDPKPDLETREGKEYYSQLDRLSYELAAKIEGLRPTPATPPDVKPNGASGRSGPKGVRRAGDASGHSEPSVPPAGGRFTVFLAEAVADLYEVRESFKDYLMQAGLHVLPEVWYPSDPDDYRRAVEQDLRRSDLFVQMLSPRKEYDVFLCHNDDDKMAVRELDDELQDKGLTPIPFNEA